MQHNCPANGESQGPFFLLFSYNQFIAWAHLAQGIDLPRPNQGSLCHLLAGRAGVGLVQLGQEQPSLANLHSKDWLCSGKQPQTFQCNKHVICWQHVVPGAKQWQQAARCSQPWQPGVLTLFDQPSGG